LASGACILRKIIRQRKKITKQDSCWFEKETWAISKIVMKKTPEYKVTGVDLNNKYLNINLKRNGSIVNVETNN